MHKQHECVFPVDRHNGNPIAMACLERVVPIDDDLLELERDLAANLLEHAPRALAEVSARTRVDDDLRAVTAFVGARRCHG